MLLKILKKDFYRKKIITAALFIFIVLPALLIASGSNMIIELSNSLNYLFTQAEVPHFVQMHSGSIDQKAIEKWSSENDLVKNQQTVEMINIDGSDVYLGNNNVSEADSVMDLGFVKQNKSFDLLLDLENQPIRVLRGEIAVPLYHRQKYEMKIGDIVRIARQSFAMEFRVSHFVRDAQMNPSIIHSKRFVVHEADFETLKKTLGEVEYLIEFQLNDINKLSDFSNAYESSDFPKIGPSINYELFKIINVITDSIVAVIVILVSLLFCIIAVLCLRFTILASIEEDYREIGVMKAIGIQQRDIKQLYLVKYVVMAALATVIGWVLSLFLSELFTTNIMLYLGTAPKSVPGLLIPIVAAAIIFLIVVLSCMITLRRFHKITAVEALRSGNTGEANINKNFLSLCKAKIINTNIFLGIRDVFHRFKMFWLLCFVFFICTFIIIVPLNFLNTIQSPVFITYLGIGQSDIRIDLRQSENMTQRFNNMIRYIEKDNDITAFSPIVTSRFEVEDSDGVQINLNVETGDFTIFPLEYLVGTAPVQDNEIALSYLNAKDLQKEVGDTLYLVVGDQTKEMVVSGIYQDLTNGGHTAKAALPPNYEAVLWFTVSLNVKSNINTKVKEYTEAFYPARVTHSSLYLSQTMGDTIAQLGLFTLLTIVIALFVSMLITSLFLKMMIAKDFSQIAIMKGIGFSLKDIRVQYITKALLVLNVGIILGTVFSNTIGQSLVSAIWSFMGASKIRFVINPVQAYILFPLALMIAVSFTTLINTSQIKKSSIAEINAE